MPRIRTIKPDFWKSEKVATLAGADGRAARLLFIALWNFCDDVGVMRGAPAYVRAEVYPYDDDVTTGDVSRWLEMLEGGGFLVRYQRSGGTYLWVRGFTEHQVINRPSRSGLPEPSDEERAQRVSPHGAISEPSVGEGKGSGREWNGSPQPPKGQGTESQPARTESKATPAALLPEATQSSVARARDAGGLLPHESGGVAGEPLWDAIQAVHRQHRGRDYPRLSDDEFAVSRLLTLCQAEGITPAQAVKEIPKRFGHALQRAGSQFARAAERANTLSELTKRPCWAANATTPPAEKNGTQASAISNPGRGSEDESATCAGCGEVVSYAATVGQEGAFVRLGASCGCWQAWQESKVGFEKAAQWARQRRAGRAA